METEEAVGDIGLVVGIQGGLNSTSSLKISQNFGGIRLWAQALNLSLKIRTLNPKPQTLLEAHFLVLLCSSRM